MHRGEVILETMAGCNCPSQIKTERANQVVHSNWCSETKTVPWQNCIAANVNIKNLYSIVERIDGCKSSIETIIIPLKKHVATTFFGNKHTTTERING